MNRLILKYILYFVVLGAFLIFLLRGRTPFGSDNTSFAVNPETKISRIDFYQGDKKLSLEKSGENWLVNKKDEARKSAVLFILRTLREIKIKSPVSSEIFDNEIIKKKIDPVKVNIYERRKPVKSFFVYKTGSNIYGNIMKMRASSKPFIVYVPGYEDNIGASFIVNELFWKPYMVFNLLPSQISSVRLENIQDSSSSFIINCSKKDFLLSDLKKDISGWDTLKVKRYLTYYTAIPFESWVFDLSENEKNSIESGMPLYRITVKQSDGKEFILTVWERLKSMDGSRMKDSDRLWAKTNQMDEIFIMRYFDLDPILKKRSYFFRE
jgi:hypothetical protein